MRIHVTIDDEDMQDRLGRTQRALEDERAFQRRGADVNKVEAIGYSGGYPETVPTEAPKRTRKRRKLSTHPSAVAARKLRANKRAGKRAQR